MENQQFLDRLEKLKKDDAKPELWRFLKLWMREGKSRLEVAKIIRKKTDLKNPNDVTIFSRRLKTICEYFGITVQAMREHDQAEEYKSKSLELFAQMEAPKQIERVNKAFGGNIR